MDQILHRIYEIEEAAESIRKGAEDQKKARAEQMKARTADFDRRLAKETAQAIESLRTTVNARNEAALAEQREKTEAILRSMQQEFDSTHREVAQSLFEQLIRPEERRS